jgi:hypothetical protein
MAMTIEDLLRDLDPESRGNVMRYMKRIHYSRPNDCVCGAHHVSWRRARQHRQACPDWCVATGGDCCLPEVERDCA